MFGFLIALLSGALMSIQGVFNTQVTKTSGIWVANAFVQFTALLVCLAAWLATDDAVEGGTEVHAFGRRDRRGDHIYGDQGYGDAGAGQSGDDHRDLTVDRGVSDRAFRAFWRGKAAAGDAQDCWNGRGDCRNCDF